MKRRTLCIVLALMASISLTLHAADPAELVGNWIGAIDTPRGQMEIGLSLTLKDGKLTGSLLTAHGDWKVTGVTEKNGAWIVSFESPEGSGQLSGRIKDARFTGDWESPAAKGTFELTRSKKRI